MGVSDFLSFLGFILGFLEFAAVDPDIDQAPANPDHYICNNHIFHILEFRLELLYAAPTFEPCKVIPKLFPSGRISQTKIASGNCRTITACGSTTLFCKKMKYYCRPWDECRGDGNDEWGTSTWYFEVDDAGNVTRQLEAYEGGQVLKYDQDNPNDEYGGLAEQTMDLKEFQQFEISSEEFRDRWKRPTDHLEKHGDGDGHAYDPMNDYGIGHTTTPTSIGAGFLKVIFGWLRR